MRRELIKIYNARLGIRLTATVGTRPWTSSRRSGAGGSVVSPMTW